MAEMYSGKALFPGKTNYDQLVGIFKIFGTPTELTWPHVTEFSEYKSDFPMYPETDIRGPLPMIDPLGVDLLIQTLQYQPQLRISAKNALCHLYFQELHVNANTPFPPKMGF